MRLHLHTVVLAPTVTLGHLVIDDLALRTVELPWRANARGRSCVPAGFYHLVPHSGPKFSDTWALVGETVSPYEEDGVQRYACVLHAADGPEDTEGCPGIGLDFQGLRLTPQPDPDRAMELLRARLAFGGPHYLTITGRPGPVR